MQVEEKRACGSCGSENVPDAAFCWRCLVPFATASSTPPSGGLRAGSVLPPPPVPWSSGSPPDPTSTRPSKVTRVLVSVVAAAVGYLGFQFLMGSGLSLPDSMAGAARLTDPESQRFERSMADQGDRYGVDAEGGVYGSPVAPAFFVILIDAAAVETTDQLFDALVGGFSQAGAVVDEANATSGTRRDSDYRCVSAAAGAETAAACLWRDDDNVGIVLEMSGDLRGTRRLLWTVHDTVTG